MSCQYVRRHETEYLDGVLRHAATLRLEAHLESCSDCRERLDGTRDAIGALRSLPLPLPPADLYARTVTRVQENRPTLAERLSDLAASMKAFLSLALPGTARTLLSSGLLATLLLFSLVAAPAGLWPVTEESPLSQQPAAQPLLRFAGGAHDAFDESSLAVVGTVVPGGDLEISSIITPAHSYYFIERAVQRPLVDPVVVLFFESIQVLG